MNPSELSMREKAQLISVDPRQADAAYKSFPPFEEWAKCAVDTDRWGHYTSQLHERGKGSPDLLRRALEVVKRAAAINTGAIEGLYEMDRGLTFTVMIEAALWEAAIDKKGQEVRWLFESQLRGYDYVLDLATKQAPTTEACIRELHTEICRAQETYIVTTVVGRQQQTLPLGEYKRFPNHVVRNDGKIHSYAPVDLTPNEMYQLCEVLRRQRGLSSSASSPSGIVCPLCTCRHSSLC